MPSTADQLEAQCRALRAKGQTYKTIGQHFGINKAKAWIILNREQHNKNSEESRRNWYARGCKPRV